MLHAERRRITELLVGITGTDLVGSQCQAVLDGTWAAPSEVILLDTPLGAFGDEVPQEVQDALFETRARWPRCHICDLDGPEHSLHIHPDLGGPDPMWVCEHAGATVSPLGELG